MSSDLIILTAGHHLKDSGAKSSKWGNENLWTRLIRNTISFYLQNSGVNVFYDEDSWTLGETVQFAKMAARGMSHVLAVDIHLNSFFKESANGTEVLVDNNATKECLDFASKINSKTVEVLGLRDRGVKSERESHHGSLGYLDITEKSVVWEVAFLSNSKDMQSLNDKYWLLSRDISKVLIDELKI